MTLQRRNPFNELRLMQENMDRLWRRFGNAPGDPAHPEAAPPWPAPLDVATVGDDLVVRASLPGVPPDQIQVSIADNVLTIRGETAAQFDSGAGDYLMRERRRGAFHRALRLPDTVDQEQAQPRYEHGVLTITLPKAAAQRARQFPVQLADGADATANG